MLDVMGMADMLTLANEAGAAHLVIFNDVGPEKANLSTQDARRGEDPPAIGRGIKQAKGFMVARITRTDDEAETDVRALYRDYVAWQEGNGRPPLPELALR